MKKVKEKFKELLLQGIAPEKLAVTFSIGVVVGIFPVIGVTTIICFFLALIFRLNMVAIQAANYASYPLMMITVIPFYKYGNELFNNPVRINTLDDILLFSGQDYFYSLTRLFWAVANAVVLWAIIAPIGFFLIYHLSYPVIKKLSQPASLNKFHN